MQTQFRKQNLTLAISISTDDRRNVSVILLREVGYFSPRKKKHLVLMMS